MILTTNPAHKLQEALRLLREARDLAKSADAPKTAAKIRSAIDSAEGAIRNAGYRKARRDRANRAAGILAGEEAERLLAAGAGPLEALEGAMASIGYHPS